MLRSRSVAGILVVCLVALASPAVLAQDAGHHDPADVEKAFPKRAPYSPDAGRNFPTRPYFGDTTSTPRSRSTPAHSVRGSALPTPSGSRRAPR